MAISGVHLLLHSPEAERLRAALHEVFGWPHVDAHPGWPIFALPAAELAVHPADEPHHEISLMCDDLDATLAEVRTKGVETRGEPEQRRFGRAVTLLLPGGVEVLLYQPEHPTAI
jgi:hypothetical protein